MLKGSSFYPHSSLSSWIQEAVGSHSVNDLRIYVMPKVANRLRMIDPNLLKERRFKKVNCVIDPILALFFGIIYGVSRLYYRGEVAFLTTAYRALIKHVEQTQWEAHAFIGSTLGRQPVIFYRHPALAEERRC